MEVVLALDPRAHRPLPREREHPIFSALHPIDVAAIRVAGRRVCLPGGTVLARIGDPLDTVWFPEDAIVSVAGCHAEGRAADVGLIGPEGMAGWPMLLGQERVLTRSTVELGGGHLIAVPAAAMAALCEARLPLRRALLAFVSRFWEQVVGTISTTLHGAPDIRLARWLLLYHDRLEGDTLAITHQRLADLLGVRRATVTDWLHLMEGDRLLRCTRGRLTIRDREALIRLAGTAYAGVGGSLAAGPPQG